MEYRDDKDLYLSLPKKELQELCRRYGLSPYMTKPNLVDALYCYLKRKNGSPIFQVESSSLCSALISPLEYGSKSYNMVHAPKDSHWNINRPGEKRKRKFCSQNLKCREKQNSVGDESYYKASGSRINRDLEYPLYEGENFQLTCKKRETFVSRNEPGCNENHLYRKKSPKISFSDRSLSFPRKVGESNAPLILSTDLDHGACRAENAPTCSIKSPKSIPSFEFYIRSEEGVNLVVDLNSNLSDLSTRLESELCCHNLVDNKFGSLRKELLLLGKCNKAIKVSFLQNTDAKQEMINECVDSAKQRCETIVVDEQPLLFSPPNSVVQNHVTSGAESDPIDTQTIPVESSVKYSTISHMNSMARGSEISLECQNLEIGNKNCKDLTVQNTCSDVGPNLVYPGSLSTGSVEMQPPEVFSHIDDSCPPCRNNYLQDVVDLTVDAETRDDEMKSPEVVSHKDDSCSPGRNNNWLDVVDLTLDEETRDDELAYSSTCQDYVYTFVDEREKGEVADGVQTSESFHFTKSLEKTSEDSEAFNVLKRKVQHSKGKYLKVHHEYNARILRSRKRLMERVLPRRSMRVVPK